MPSSPRPKAISVRILTWLATPNAQVVITQEPQGSAWKDAETISLLGNGTAHSLTHATYERLREFGWLTDPETLSATVSTCRITEKGKAAYATHLERMSRFRQERLFDEEKKEHELLAEGQGKLFPL